MSKRICLGDEWLLPLIKETIKVRPTYGYRRITAMIRKECKRLDKNPVNHKRIYRIMKQNNLLLQKYAPRPARVHDGKVQTLKSNLRWCSDGFALQCWNGERIEIAFSLDCCDREVISWVTSSRGIDGGLIRDLMLQSLESRFQSRDSIPHRMEWLTDNGPGYVARETVAFGRKLGFEICTTAPYSPESNGMAEAFVKTFKRDYAQGGDLSSAEAVRKQLKTWFDDYNENAPHKGLGMKSPREYRRENLAC